MIFKQKLSPQNGRYTPLLCFHLDYYSQVNDASFTRSKGNLDFSTLMVHLTSIHEPQRQPQKWFNQCASFISTVQSRFSDTLFSDKSRFSDNFAEDHFFST